MKLVYHPDSVLYQKALSVPPEQDVSKLVESMVKVMGREGVGLAANQVGVLLRVLVIDQSAGVHPLDRRVMVNPVILQVSRTTSIQKEGCLSLPGISQKVERADRVTVLYEGGPLRSLREVTLVGLDAKIFLHEYDHLEGRTLLHYVTSSMRKRELEEIIAREVAGGQDHEDL